MSFFSRLFGRKGSGAGPGDLEKRLQALEAEAEVAAPGYVGTAYNRAGDAALRGDETGRAVAYYGRAIDAFLQDGQREAARGVANKIIRVQPAAVRTLCTLTWLDLAAKHSATALLHLRDYIEAAKAIDRTGLAASQVYEMARVIPESEFIGAAADALDVLDFSELADEVRGWVKSDGSPEAITDPAALAEACLVAAVKSNQRGAKTIGDERRAVAEPEAAASEPEEEEVEADTTESEEEEVEADATESEESEEAEEIGAPDESDTPDEDPSAEGDTHGEDEIAGEESTEPPEPAPESKSKSGSGGKRGKKKGKKRGKKK